MIKRIKSFMVRNYLPYIPKYFLKRRYPNSVVVEVTNVCNLNCQFCLTSYETRKRGLMSYENFTKIVDKLPQQIRQINMNFSGEPLLNKDVFRMVKYAKQRGISTYISTNAALLNNFDFKEIFGSGLNDISVCLDGASKKTHEFYRRGSKFEVVKKNIKDFCDVKKRLNAKLPVITMQTLVTKRNEHEIPEIIELAKELGVDKLYLRKMSINNYEGEEKIEIAKKELPSDKYSMYRIEGDKVIIKNEPKYCYSIFDMVILWNGDVTTCCFDYDAQNVYGNILEDSFLTVWHKMPRDRIIREKFKLCKECEISSDIDYERIDLK